MQPGVEMWCLVTQYVLWGRVSLEASSSVRLFQAETWRFRHQAVLDKVELFLVAYRCSRATSNKLEDKYLPREGDCGGEAAEVRSTISVHPQSCAGQSCRAPSLETAVSGLRRQANNSQASSWDWRLGCGCLELKGSWLQAAEGGTKEGHCMAPIGVNVECNPCSNVAQMLVQNAYFHRVPPSTASNSEIASQGRRHRPIIQQLPLAFLSRHLGYSCRYPRLWWFWLHA
jgi:hypothetical protein